MQPSTDSQPEKVWKPRYIRCATCFVSILANSITVKRCPPCELDHADEACHEQLDDLLDHEDDCKLEAENCAQCERISRIRELLVAPFADAKSTEEKRD